MDDILSNEPDRERRVSAPGDEEHMPTATIVCGRGRVGKTVIANALIQFARQHGATIEVWNGDRQNVTHNLTIFHPDASAPAADSSEERRLWFEANLERQVQCRFDSVFDMTGSDPLVRQLAADTNFMPSLHRGGVRAVPWYVLGPEIADLDYLKLSLESGLFMPEATVLVLNAGLVTSGRVTESAFADIMRHRVVKSALSRGARVVYFPRLICMPIITEQGISFEDAKSGRHKAGHPPLSFFDEGRVEVFWDRDVPKFFSQIPRLWLPRMPGWRS